MPAELAACWRTGAQDIPTLAAAAWSGSISISSQTMNVLTVRFIGRRSIARHIEPESGAILILNQGRAPPPTPGSGQKIPGLAQLLDLPAVPHAKCRGGSVIADALLLLDE